MGFSHGARQGERRVGGGRPGWLGRLGLGVVVGVAALFVVGFVGVGSAAGSFGVSDFDGVLTDGSGGVDMRAGAHPFASSYVFSMNFHSDPDGSKVPDGGGLKEVVVDLPLGFSGDPASTPTCRPADFVDPPDEAATNCAASTQVGIAQPVIGAPEFGPIGSFPVYNLDPPPGVVASFGFRLLKSPVFLDASVRPGDHGLRIRAHNVSQLQKVFGSAFTIWGVPADPAHDGQRSCKGTPPPCSTDAPLRPFLTNPTSCTPPGTGIETQMRVSSWPSPDVFVGTSVISHDLPGYTFDNPLARSEWGSPRGMSGCERLPFDPSVKIKPDTVVADAPTGLAFDLSIPQEGLANPTGLATAHLKDVRVTLPEGMTLSPASANGLQGCSDEQIAIATEDPVRCPDASKIGSVTATTPVLREPLEGSVYVGSQKSSDPESGEMFRIFLVLENKRLGLLVKLAGQVRVNKTTGRVETLFANNPQLPISTVSLRLKAGPRAPLSTPLECGEKTIEAQLTSWSGKTADLTDTFTVDCPPDTGTFAPAFNAGTLVPLAGAFSPFLVQIDRPDRQQYLSGVTLDMPTGISGKLRGLPLCPEAQAAAGTCPLESRIGTATVAAGSGSNPFYLQGSVSMTGPYKGAFYGFSVAVRAAAGPFDLGTVVVRQPVIIDRADGHITVPSDTLPTVVSGIPVRLRSVNVDVNRPGFTLNPTSCAEKQIEGTFVSTQGAVSKQNSRFQVGDCQALGFTPKLSLALTGKGQTTDGKHPGLKGVLTRPSAGQAGLKNVMVKLPLSLALDPEHAASDRLCEYEEGLKPNPNCPKSSIIGKAKAITPILNKPLAGNVYFVKNVRIDKKTGRRIRTLPTLLILLRGDIALNVRATTSIQNNKLVSTFNTIPDAPVTQINLTLQGGKQGILVATRNLCKGTHTATTNLTAQNNKRTNQNTKIKTPCRKTRNR